MNNQSFLGMSGTLKVNYKVMREEGNLYDSVPEDTHIVNAEYCQSISAYDNGNPFIEAIPLKRTDGDLIDDFSSELYIYDREKVKDMSLSEKLIDISLLRDTYSTPLPFHKAINDAIYQSFLKAYRHRKLIINDSNITNEGDTCSKLYKDINHKGTSGSFFVIGYGGTGKSYGVARCLANYKQVIIHETTGGGRVIQIVYIVVQCPPHGNMSAFYSNIGHEIDRALGHTMPFIQNMIDKTNTLGKKMNIVTDLIERYNIGLIVFDEIQMFITSKASKNRINVKRESFEAITTIMNTTDVSIGIIGTEMAYKMIFKDQMHQYRRLGLRIQADNYCSNTKTFMRIMNELLRYQWTETFLEKSDITPEFLQAFKDCTHGIIDQIISLYIAVQHEAVYTSRKSKINDKFIRSVHKKYFGHMDNVFERLDDDQEYERYKNAYNSKLNDSVKLHIAEAQQNEHEANIQKALTNSKKKENERLLVGKAISAIQLVTTKYSAKAITDTAKTLLKTNVYIESESDEFVKDVMKSLEGKKVKRKSKTKSSVDINSLAIKLDNSNQNIN